MHFGVKEIITWKGAKSVEQRCLTPAIIADDVANIFKFHLMLKLPSPDHLRIKHVKLGLCWTWFWILQSCNHTIVLWHTTTLAYQHTTVAISSPWGQCMWKSAVDSIKFNVNFIQQHIYKSIQVMFTTEGPRPVINLGISSTTRWAF